MKKKEYHGARRTREYSIWTNMRYRCEKPYRNDYEYYGGRGIRVCKRWRESFAAFIQDMGACPAGLTLERIKNGRGYYRSNCRWATRAEQSRNRRTYSNSIATKLPDVIRLRESGMSLKKIATTLRIGYGSVQRTLQHAITNS